jgi:hypothetical protein
MNLRLEGRLSARYAFCGVHLYSARTQATIARERAADVGNEQRSPVILSVSSSVAFLEALVHEVVLDARDKGPDWPALRPLTPDVLGRIGSVQLDGTGSSLPVFNRVLAAAGATPFDLQTEPHAAARTLFYLRNALIHSRPADTGLAADDLGTHETRVRETATALLRYGFELYAGPSNADWPDRILGPGCAEWALATAQRFAVAFVERLGIAPTWT